MSQETAERWLCLACSEWFDADPALSACPGCGAQGVPASSKDMVQVKITWHELRCLVMWAERDAYQHRDSAPEMQKVVYGIADRLMVQHLDKRSGLTMASEVAELRAHFGPRNVKTHNIPEPPDANGGPP